MISRPLVTVLWGRTSFFADRWSTIIAAIRYLLRKHPAMEEARAYVVKQAEEAKALLEVLDPGPVRTALESFADILASRSA